MKNQQIIEQLGNMSVMDFLELTKQLEETWGVSAQDALASAHQVIQPVVEPEPPSEYDLVMTAHGPTKVQVVRVVREVTGLGLRECMEMVTELPSVIRAGLEPEEAEELAARFRELGAQIELR